MTARNRLVILTSDGIQLAELADLEAIEYWRVLNDKGGFNIITRSDFDESLLGVDRLIEFWRTPKGGEETLMMVGLLRWWEWFENSDGFELLSFGGPDQNDLLDRRIVAYYAGEDEADKTQEADDLLKAIVRENMGALAPNDEAGRPRAYDADYFSVAPDFAHAPSVSRRFSWRKVFPILKEVAASSRDLGTPLYFDMVPAGASAQFDFRTFINLMGIDRTVTSGLSPIIFSKENGNLGMPKMREDWANEWNYVYGGGQGEETDRVIDPEDDPWRMHRSIWNRREVFQDAREEDTILGVANKAYQRMQQERPLLKFSGKLLDAPQSRFGIDWNFGDKVTAEYRGQFDGVVNAYRVSIDQNGNEDVTARLEVDLATG